MSVEIGEMVEDFKVIKYLGKTKNYVKLYEVECMRCGKRKQIQLARLNSHCTTKHSNKSCGNYLEKYDPYLGLTKNDYTIKKYLYSNDGEYRYVMKCNVCGMEAETYIHNFLRGYGTNHKNCTDHIPQNKYLKRFRKIYSCMRQRTCNPNYGEYHYYGGRGINSDYFEDFITFYYDMFESYQKHVDEYGEKNTSLDRIDPDGNYTKDNCRWATNSEQRKNTRKAKMSNDYSERK